MNSCWIVDSPATLGKDECWMHC